MAQALKLEQASPPLVTVGRYRWIVCALLFFATTINYMDRQILSLLKPILDNQMGWTNEQFGAINSAFQGAYAVGGLLFGWLVDRIGSKLGYTISITGWSFAALGHALVSSVGGFFAARACLGITEAGNFPTSIKTVALWLPKKERAFATSLFNSGANVGPIIAPIVFPWIALTWGWQAAFTVAGIAGLIWLFFWLPFYDVPERQKRLTAEELAFIQSDRDELHAEKSEVPLVRWAV
jgi:MFS transporter, ACS family, hexuronate transporter